MNPRPHGGYNCLQLDALSGMSASGPASEAVNCSAPFTIDAWVKFNGLPAQVNIVAQDGVFAFGSQGASIFYELEGQGSLVSDASISTLVDDSWHYICATFDGGMVRLYIDGVLNCAQSFMTPGVAASTPVTLGIGLEGLVRVIRVLSNSLTSEEVVESMFLDVASLGPIVAAWFDFSQVPPVDIGPSAFLLAPAQGEPSMISISPALSMGFQGFARPFADQRINPGGGLTDPYSVQSWIYLDDEVSATQAIFVNSDLRDDTGIALYLQYDNSSASYKLVSQRGSNGDAGQVLVSNGTVSTGTWVNVATTFDGATLSIYLQGVLDSTLNCLPISNFRIKSDLLIGAAIIDGIPSLATVLQGYIREVDVWSVCLSGAQIKQFMDALPDPLETGLSAAYNFTASPARNQANGHPIGLADGAVLSAQVGTQVLDADNTAQSLPSAADAQLLSSLRSALDLGAFARQHADALRTAMRSDTAAFTDPSDQKLIEDNWNELIGKLNGSSGSISFWIESHRANGEDLLVCHRPCGSSIIFRAPVGSINDCVLWKIRLIVVVVFGVLDAVFGLTAKLTDAATAYIAGLLNVAKISSKFGATEVGGLLVFQIVQAIQTNGSLRPLIRMILEIGFWTMLRVAAQAALVCTGLASARLVASLAITAANLIQMLANRPADCEPVPTLTLASISFNYGIAAQALQIRRNRDTPVNVPEWTPACRAAAESPAAYQATLQLSMPTVLLTFVSEGVGPFEVRALGGGVLGALVVFPVSGEGFVWQPLSENQLANGGVGVSNVQWIWEYRVGDGGWLPLATTNHRIYSLLAAPTAPWTNGDAASCPWTSVLDWSCKWAMGCQTPATALSAITTTVNGGIGLNYNAAGMGAPRYINTGTNQFLCSDFLSYLADRTQGNGNLVNCADCAAIVTMFGNAIGCNVYATLLLNNVGNNPFFSCNQIQAIGSNEWAFPFPNALQPNGYSFHEVARTEAPVIPFIYDACLKINGAADPWTVPLVNPVPQLPTNIAFTLLALNAAPPIATPFDLDSYRERLAKNDLTGITACIMNGPRDNTNNGRRSFI